MFWFILIKRCVSVSERLSSFKKLNGLFIYPSTSKSTRFLYYFCLCKSFKELFLFVACQVVFLICGCKGTAFFLNYQKFSREIFNFRVFFMHLLISVNYKNSYTLLYILYRERGTILLRENHVPVARGLQSLHGRIGKNTLICNKTMAVYKKIRTFALSIREKWIVIIE